MKNGTSKQEWASTFPTRSPSGERTSLTSHGLLIPGNQLHGQAACTDDRPWILTRRYEALMSLLVTERRLTRIALSLLRPEPGESVLDLGCGTGRLAVQLKQEHPRAIVVGYDTDPAVLHRAVEKAARARVSVTWCRDPLSHPSLPEQSFDFVTSTLLLHNLSPESKRAALDTACRFLRPGGRFVLADFTRPVDLIQWIAFTGVRLLDGLAVTAEHAAGRLVRLVEGAGFDDVSERRRLRTVIGTIGIITARKRGGDTTRRCGARELPPS